MAFGSRIWRKFVGEIGRRNFGKNLNWEKNLVLGLEKVKEKQKPGMIVCHKSWCGACRALKPKFESSKDIEALSASFILISLEDDDLPKDKKYMPDGDYVPRVLFLNSQGVLMTDVVNDRGSQEYKYFYSEPEQIVRSMKKVLGVS